MNAEKKEPKAGLRDHWLFPVFYMFIAMLLFCSVLIGIARATRQRVQANERILFEKAALMAVGANITDRTPARKIHQLFTSNITEPSPDTGSAYVYTSPENRIVYALPVTGQGFWDTIRGVIGIDDNLKTVTGIAFYEQKETPGLGAEIVKPAFRNQFQGITLAAGEQPVGIVSSSTKLNNNEVYAVTGATQTCIRLEKMINTTLIEWRKAMESK